MGYYLIVLSSFLAENSDSDIDIHDMYGLIKRNTWVFKDHQLALQQKQLLDDQIESEQLTNLEFKLVSFDSLHKFRSIDLLGKYRIRHGNIMKYQLLRSCLTQSYLPDQVINPELCQGRTEMYVIDINKHPSTKLEPADLTMFSETSYRDDAVITIL